MNLSKVIERVILTFWAVYFTLVLASNLTDVMAKLNLLPAEFKFVSGNYKLMEKVVAIYNTPAALVAVMFAGVLLLELFSATAFWAAAFCFDAAKRRKWAEKGFCVSLTLWFGFIVADELFVAFDVADLERAHVAMLSCELLSFLVYLKIRART